MIGQRSCYEKVLHLSTGFSYGSIYLYFVSHQSSGTKGFGVKSQSFARGSAAQSDHGTRGRTWGNPAKSGGKNLKRAKGK